MSGLITALTRGRHAPEPYAYPALAEFEASRKPMFGTIHLATFVLSGLVLNLYPGPDTMYIIGRSLSQGRKAGIVSVLGISTGGMIHTLLAGLGLSAVLAASVKAFFAVKTIGALYLLYIGIRAIASRRAAADTATYLGGQSHARIYRQGLLTNLFNPKVALFFLSFLPQFVDPGSKYGPLTFLFLGSIFLCTGTIWCMIVAVFSAALSERLKRNERITFVFEKITGLIFIGLGLNLFRDTIVDRLQ